MNQPDTARFIYGGRTYTRDEMLADHDHDDVGLSDWVQAARPGDRFAGICQCIAVPVYSLSQFRERRRLFFWTALEIYQPSPFELPAGPHEEGFWRKASSYERGEYQRLRMQRP